MRTASSLIMLFTGAVAGVAFVLSCSDDSPGPADAAVCDCAPAEPPLAGRIMNISQTVEIAPNARGSQEAVCPSEAQLLSGSCTNATFNPTPDLSLEQSGFYDSDRSWRCAFKNNEATPVTIKVTARCLMPAQ